MAGPYDALNSFLSDEAIDGLNQSVADAIAGEVFTLAEKTKLDALFPVGTGVALAVYSNTGVGAPIRPAANAVGAVAGVLAIMIWNFTDKAPQYSDGTNWYDATGNLT